MIIMKIFLRLAAGDTFCARGTRLCADRHTFCARGTLLCADGHTFCARGTLLCADEQYLCARGTLLCADRHTFCTRGTLLCADEQYFCARKTLPHTHEKISIRKRVHTQLFAYGLFLLDLFSFVSRYDFLFNQLFRIRRFHFVC